jgi:hypothetical protein
MVEVGERGGHAFVEDTCVTCHMETTPPPDILSYNQGGTNHTFFADRNICSDCHSPHLTPDDVQAAIQHSLDIVEGLIEDGYYDLIDDLTSSGSSIDFNGDAEISDASVISEIQFTGYHGAQALTVIFNDESVAGPNKIEDIVVLDAARGTTLTLADYADDALMKSGWNWTLVSNDGSLGVHNPFFAHGALIAARDSLLELSGDKSPQRVFERTLSSRPGVWQVKPLETRRGARR